MATKFHISSTFIDPVEPFSHVDAVTSTLESGDADQITDPFTTARMIEDLMSRRHAETLDERKIRVFCGTYNVNGQSPDTENILPWFSSQFDEKHDNPDMMIFGFQELVVLAMKNVVYSTSEAELNEKKWRVKITEALELLAPKVYTLLDAKILVATSILVFIRRSYLDYITELAVDMIPTGITIMPGRKFGNKGGVSIKFKFFESEVCLVAAHLAAHQDEVPKRNESYREIHDKLFAEYSIDKCNIIIWFGDLNYRISSSVEDTLALIEKKEFVELFAHDQLNQEKNVWNKIFENFKEGDINFAPTFKFETSATKKLQYKTESEGKPRVPSWTDRILWSEPSPLFPNQNSVLQLSYCSHPELTVSDHKPVSSIFEMTLGQLNAIKYKKVREEVLKEIDTIENNQKPTIDLSLPRPYVLDFGVIYCCRSYTKSFEIRNSGSSPCYFSFDKHSSQHSQLTKQEHDSLLKVSPMKGPLQVNEQCKIDITIYINHHLAKKFNSGQFDLNNLLFRLILHKGAHYFMTVNGDYRMSSLTLPLITLCHLPKAIASYENPEDIRKLILSEESLLNKTDLDLLSMDNIPLRIPKELFCLTNIIVENDGFKYSDIFIRKGDPNLVLNLLNEIDKGPFRQDNKGYFNLMNNSNSSQQQKRESNLCDDDVNLIDFGDNEKKDDDSVTETDVIIRQSSVLDEELTTEVKKESISIAAARLIVVFLSGLPEPVIPRRFFDQAIDCESLDEAIDVLDQLPPIHRNTFNYITSMLNEALLYASSNELTAMSLAELFGSCILGSDENSSSLNSSRNINVPMSPGADLGHAVLDEPWTPIASSTGISIPFTPTDKETLAKNMISRKAKFMMYFLHDSNIPSVLPSRLTTNSQQNN